VAEPQWKIRERGELHSTPTDARWLIDTRAEMFPAKKHRLSLDRLRGKIFGGRIVAIIGDPIDYSDERQ